VAGGQNLEMMNWNFLSIPKAD